MNIIFLGKNSVYVRPGDRIIIRTPGGGGYGSGESEVTSGVQSSGSAGLKRLPSGSLEKYILDQESA